MKWRLMTNDLLIMEIIKEYMKQEIEN